MLSQRTGCAPRVVLRVATRADVSDCARRVAVVARSPRAAGISAEIAGGAGSGCCARQTRRSGATIELKDANE